MTRINAKIFHRIVHNEVNGSSIHSYSGLKLNDSKVLECAQSKFSWPLMVMVKAARRERPKPSQFQHLLFIISSLFPLNSPNSLSWIETLQHFFFYRWETDRTTKSYLINLVLSSPSDIIQFNCTYSVINDYMMVMIR